MKKIIRPEGPAKKINLLRYCPEKNFRPRPKSQPPPPPQNIKWTVPNQAISGMADSMIKPVYLKNSDIQPEEGDRITDFELMECVIKKIGNDLHCLH